MMERTPRVALVGHGRWGQNIARALARKGALAAIGARRPEGVVDAAAAFGVEVTDIAGLLAREDIDAVAIAVPPEAHAELVAAALTAGKHVFVEKPMALSTADAEAMKAAAEAANKVLMIGHIMRHNPAFTRLEALVRRGAVGRIREVRSVRHVMRAGIDPLWMLAPHDASMLLALLGEPLEVSGLRQGEVHRSRLRFPDGVTAEIEVGCAAAAKRSELTVRGEAGVLVFEDTAEPARRLRLNGEPLALLTDDPLAAEMAWFLDAVRGARPPMADATEGLAVVRLLEGAGA